MLGVFANTVSADEKYFLCNSENLRELIQIQLPKKTFFFTNSYFISELYMKKVWTFSKKVQIHRLCISEITDSERRG